MSDLSKRESLVLFLGDVVCFLVSLWLTLFLRFGLPPSFPLYYSHLVPFSILFVLWTLVFFIAGLYEKHTVILKSKLPGIILNAEIINSILAIAFFYFIPYFGITPKTNLFIYLFVSSTVILIWRIYGFEIFGSRHRQNAILISSGEEMRELKEEVNNNNRYNLKFISSIDLDKTESLDFQEEILKRIYSEGVYVIAVDLRNEKVEPILPHLYNLIFSKVRFIDMHKIYEDIFDRIPLSLVKYSWFLENVSVSSKVTYDFLKRVMDVAMAAVLGVVYLAILPFAALAIWLDDGGPVFISQERVGRNSKVAKILKFRTMTVDDGGKEEKKNGNKITRVGGFFRKTRIDELPQLWNVLKGDLSMIGPRPELPELVKLYEKEIPYYNIRHLITPGLSGWAQLYHKNPPKFDPSCDETKIKLSYDLYYIKNRSFLLDVKIALKTLKALLSRAGR